MSSIPPFSLRTKLGIGLAVLIGTVFGCVGILEDMLFDSGVREKPFVRWLYERERWSR